MDTIVDGLDLLLNTLILCFLVVIALFLLDSIMQGPKDDE